MTYENLVTRVLITERRHPNNWFQVPIDTYNHIDTSLELTVFPGS